MTRRKGHCFINTTLAVPRIDLPVYFLCGPETMSWGETVLITSAQPALIYRLNMR